MIASPLSDRPDYGTSGASVPRGEDPGEHIGFIEKTPGEDSWCVRSESNPKWSGGCYPSRAQAEERLKQVEMFKHLK